MNYCGTCKTLGTRYGQRARMLLNHDTVFLAELLTELGGAPAEYQRAYRSYNCMSMPAGDLPVALDFAAAATMALADWKARDHVEDGGSRAWSAAQRLYRKPFARAAKRLRSWKFPTDRLEAALGSQQKREQAPESVEQLAWPTAEATALFCEHGAVLIGRPELRSPLAELGRTFGTLIYLLDAYEDFEKDAKKNEFNALATLGLTRLWAKTRLRELAAEMEAGLAELPVSDAFRAEINSRLRLNLASRFGETLPIVCSTKHKTRREILSGRWANAKKIASEFRAREAKGWLKGAAVFASVAVVAFAMPREAREAGSYKECLGLGFNLMAFGSLIAMAAGGPPPLDPQLGQQVAEHAAKAAAKSKGSWCCCSDQLPDACCNECCCCCEGMECCDICGSCGECGSCCDC